MSRRGVHVEFRVSWGEVSFERLGEREFRVSRGLGEEGSQEEKEKGVFTEKMSSRVSTGFGEGIVH